MPHKFYYVHFLMETYKNQKKNKVVIEYKFFLKPKPRIPVALTCDL